MTRSYLRGGDMSGRKFISYNDEANNNLPKGENVPAGRFVARNLSEAEEIQEQRKSKSEITVLAELISYIIVVLIAIFLYSMGYNKIIGFYIPIDLDILKMHIFEIILVSIGAILLIHIIEKLVNILVRKYQNLNRNVICEKCYKIKKKDSIEWCECLGKFVEMEHYKWVEDN